jgi:hypothetical protein
MTDPMQDITFHDGVTLKIPSSIIAKYPKISPNAIVFRSSEEFKKFILPVLYGQTENLRIENYDTVQEQIALINNLRYYKIDLPDLQKFELAQNIGLIDEINEIKNYVVKHTNKRTGKLDKNPTERINAFQIFWNGMLENISITDIKQIYALQPLLFSNLYTLILKSDLIELSRINLMDEMMSVFVKYFSKFVIKKDKGCLINLKFTFNGTLNISSAATGIGSAIAIPMSQTGSGSIIPEASNFLGKAFAKLQEIVMPTTTTPSAPPAPANIYPKLG